MMTRFLVLALFLASAEAVVPQVHAGSGKVSLKTEKVLRLIRQGKFDKAADRINIFQHKGGDFEKALAQLTDELKRRDSRRLMGLFKEFVERRQWDNALRVAAAWETVIDRHWKYIPAYLMSLKQEGKTEVGLLYLERGDPDTARQIFDELIRSIHDLAVSNCSQNTEFFSHYDAEWEMPKPVHQVLPSYTEEAVAQKIEGEILLLGIVEEDGRVTDLRLIEDLGYGLDERTVDAVQEWRFEPARFNQKPVRCIVSFEVKFMLR